MRQREIVIVVRVVIEIALFGLVSIGTVPIQAHINKFVILS
jgi:hypothetical protein